MRFDPAAVAALPQDQVLKLIVEAKPTASSSVENPPSQTTSSEWLQNFDPAMKKCRIIGGDIAAAIGVNADEITTVTCFTNLRSAKCGDYYGVNSSDDLSAADIAYISKTAIGNFVLAPMLKSDADALKLAYDDHDLSQDYSSNHKFGWKNGGSLQNQFPNIENGDTVVLTAVPNVIAAGFGTTKPHGDLDSVSAAFANLEQGLDLRPYINVMKLLKLNNYQSFQETGAAGVGALLTDINTDFLTKIGGDSSLLDTFELNLGRLPPTSDDGKLTTAEFCKVQMNSLFWYLAGNKTAR